MRIGRFSKSSLSAWKGRNSCVIEVRGSVTRCPASVAPMLFEEEGACIEQQEILDYISQHTEVLQGIVIAGGEPFLQPDLYSFLKELKRTKIPVSVRTEGMCPDALDDLAGAMMFQRAAVVIPYSSLGSEQEGKLFRSLDILAEQEIGYAVELYAAPGITDSEKVGGIAKRMGRTGVLEIITVDPKTVEDASLKGTDAFKKKDVLALISTAKKYCKKVELKGF